MGSIIKSKIKYVSVLIGIITLLSSSLFSQTVSLNPNTEFNSKSVDPLKEFENEKQDSDLVQKIFLKANYFLNGDSKKSLVLGRKAFMISERINFKKGIIYSLCIISDSYRNAGSNDSAFKYLNEAQKLCNQYRNKELNLKVTGNYIIYYMALNNLNKAFDYSAKFLTAASECKDTATIFDAYLRLSEISMAIGDSVSAYSYNTRAIQLAKVKNALAWMSRAYEAKSLFFVEKNADSALFYFEKCLEIDTKLNNKSGQAISLSNIGIIYQMKGESEKGLIYFKRSAELAKELGQFQSFLNAKNNITESLVLQKKYNEALKEGQEYLTFAIQANFPSFTKQAAFLLADIYEAQDKIKDAYYYKNIGFRISDSLTAVANSKNLQEAFTKYESEKKDLEISNLNKDNLIKEAEIQKQKQFKIFISVCVVFLMCLVFILGISYRQKVRSNNLLSEQKQKIESQNLLLESKNQLITDSINYAKKIQDSLLPNRKILTGYFSDSFIYYQPKDIVSGDFYWMKETHNGIIVALADCTGHGVPGALMSVLGHNGLDEVYKNPAIPSPAAVIKYLDEYVKEKTHHENPESTNTDGMALSIFEYNKQTKKIIYSNANQPVYIVRDKELIELKGNRFSIGSWDKRMVMEGEFQLQSGDCIYLFSDGYPDQKGGPQKTKYLHSKLRSLFSSLNNSSMEENHLKVKNEMDQWKGQHPQMDDILVIGLKAV